MSFDAIALLAVLNTPGAGNAIARQALAAGMAAGMPLDSLLQLPPRQLTEALPVNTDARVVSSLAAAVSHREQAERIYLKATHAGAQAVTVQSDDYPRGLLSSLGESAPVLLWIAGNMDVLAAPCGAVVGARDAGERGLLLAQACAEALVEAAMTVVSGGAQGVDMAAHSAAIGGGGVTAMVLPQGVLTFRPPREALEAMDEGRLALISACPPDMEWQTHAAVERNAFISGLSDLVCVIEPKKKGGSIRTGRAAIEQGKPVLVYPAPSFPEGARLLQAAGAVPLLGPDGQFDPNRITGAASIRQHGDPRQAELF
ncbi:MAG: hypothetical protein AMXMBFR84_02510 [Candidatus Hydrogenedentota bacterium]